jgi:asparagine synthase (glutamine-hydrolysing)
VSAIVAAAGAPLTPETKTWVAQATAFSAYAGPDGHSAHVGERFGLGLALLRTGPQDAESPLTTNGRTWISADARLDGRHWEPTHAEQIARAYDTAGEGFLEQIAGDFAFALWDEGRAELICARDHFGVAPLHYARTGDELLVATAIEALLLHPAVSDELDERAVADFLVHNRYEDMDATIFADIRRLAPAHRLTWRDGQVSLRRYWRQPRWEPLARFGRRSDYSDHFRELLRESVADRITDAPLAMPLSGGMDSPSVAALALDVLRDRGLDERALRAVTLTLGGDSGDEEADFALHVARYLEIEADVVEGAKFAPLDPFETPPLVTPEPSWYRRTNFELQMARSLAGHGHIALSGLGGDPMLWFTPWYWADWLMRGRVLRLGRAWGQLLRLVGNRPHPHLLLTMRHGWDRAAARTRGEVPEWIAPDFATRTQIAKRVPPASSPPSGPRGREIDVRTMGGDAVWPTLFWWGDPAFTRLPVRFRHPFFDIRLVRFAASLPPEPWLMDKRILREGMRGRLPEAVRTRRKTLLVDAPLPGWEPEVMEHLAELVRAAPGLDRFVDPAALAAALTAPGAGADHTSDQVLKRPLGLAHWLTHWRTPQPVA